MNEDARDIVVRTGMLELSGGCLTRDLIAMGRGEVLALDVDSLTPLFFRNSGS